jgi:hypothetical protein
VKEPFFNFSGQNATFWHEHSTHISTRIPASKLILTLSAAERGKNIFKPPKPDAVAPLKNRPPLRAPGLFA